MSPKNYKYSKVLFSLLQSVLFKSPIWSTLVLFGLHWFYQVYSFTLVLFYLLRTYFVCIGHIQSIPLWFYLVHICPIRSILSTQVLFNQHWSYSVHYGPIQSTLVIFSSICSYSVHMSTLVLIYPFILIWSTSVHLVPIRSYSIHSIYLVHLYPLRSILCTYI